MTLISTKCVSSDPPKALAVRVASDYLEATLKSTDFTSKFTIIKELEKASAIQSDDEHENFKPSNQLISGIREAMYGHSQIQTNNSKQITSSNISLEISSLPDHHITIYQSCRLFLLIQQLLTVRPSSSSSQLLKTSTSFQQLFYDDPENLSATFFLQQHLVRTLHHYHKQSFPASLTILRTIKQIVSDDFTQSYVKNLLKFGIADILNQIYVSIVNNQYKLSNQQNSNYSLSELYEEAESCVLKLIYASCKAISSLVIQTSNNQANAETSSEAKLALSNAQSFSNLSGCLIKRLSDFSENKLHDSRIPLLNTSRVLFIVLQLYGVSKGSNIDVGDFTSCLSKDSVLIVNGHMEIVKFIIKSMRRYVKVEREVNKRINFDVKIESESLKLIKNKFQDDASILSMLDDIFS